MRRSRHPRPKERKTGNHQYPCGNPPPHGRPPNASPGASETAVNLAAGTTLRRPNKGAPGSGWKNPDQNLDEEDRRTSRPTRRGYRRLKSRPSPLTPGETPRRERSRQHPPTPEGRGGRRRAPDWHKLNPCRRPRRPRTRRADKIPGRATSMRTSKRMPGTGRRSDRSVIHRRNCGRATAPPPDDAKSGQKKETFPWSALSTSVGPITRRPTATPARAGDSLTLLITRHARNSRQKRQPQQASQSQHTKWPPQQQPKRDTRYPTTLLQKRSHPPRLQMLPGKRSQTSS